MILQVLLLLQGASATVRGFQLQRRLSNRNTQELKKGITGINLSTSGGTMNITS